MQLNFDKEKIPLKKLIEASWSKDPVSCDFASSTLKNIEASHHQMLSLIESKIPVYGVTTGFGDSSRRLIEPRFVETLQSNLVSYLLCGTGPHFSREISKAVMICRLRSLSQGLSGVSVELINRFKMYIENDWIPAIPQEGSLGASGDLIPLAYVAEAIQGKGMMFSSSGGLMPTEEVLKKAGVGPYTLKAKEALAIVNGTSVMAGIMLVNLSHCRNLLNLSVLATSWACMAQHARVDAFSEIINSRAKSFSGQAEIAKQIRSLLKEENYQYDGFREGDLIQSRYSLRCAPQILGPILETLKISEAWCEDEINAVSDNPVIDSQGEWAMGGNFYGGYISHGMDYMKMGLAHIADMLDRQFATLIDEKANSGLSANLADWNNIPADQRNLHHGLKGLHQSMSALTSEVIQKSIPNGIFSRSSESHNQDKVSLGLSAAVQCGQMIETLYTLNALYFVALAQGLDLRGQNIKGPISEKIYRLIRSEIPKVSFDQSLEKAVRSISNKLKGLVKES